jgi:hypothetical protein
MWNIGAYNYWELRLGGPKLDKIAKEGCFSPITAAEASQTAGRVTLLPVNSRSALEWLRLPGRCEDRSAGRSLPDRYRA